MPLNFVVKAVATAAMMAAQMALSASRKIEGPRLDDTKVTTAEYGTPITDFWGIRKLQGLPVIWADDLREQKVTSKTKGGKYSQYKYYGYFAVVVAGHQIDGIRKIWLDDHLVYQTAYAGPISIIGAIKTVFGINDGINVRVDRNLRMYMGTEDQDPDPLIEAWFEDQEEFGANCTSAMRGIAYIVFDNIPLEKFGNRIPQVTVEAVRSKVNSYLYEALDSGFTTAQVFFSPNRQFAVFRGNTTSEVWDVPNRTRLATLPVGGAYVMNDDGSFYTAPNGVNLVTLGGAVTEFATAAEVGSFSELYRAGGQLWLTDGAGGNALLVTGSPGDAVTPIATSPGARSDYYFTDADDPDVAWVIGHTDVANSFALTKLSAVTETFTITGAPVDAGAAYGMDNGAGQILVSYGGYLYLIDKTDGSIVAGPDNSAGTITVPRNIFLGTDPGDETMWIGPTQISTRDLSIIRSIDPTLWGTGTGLDHPIYDPINHALWADGVLGAPTIFYLDRIGSSDVTLGTIIEDEGDQVGCEIDASTLDQLVPGYSMGPGPAKDRMAPILDLHNSILRLHNMGIQGIKRSTASVASIDVGDFVREGDEARYEVEVTQDGDLPQRIEVKYAALNNDQEINNVIAFRHSGAVDTSRVTQIDMSTYADTPDAMQQKADRFLRNMWNNRATVKNGLTAQYMAAETGDVYDLDLDGVVWTCELEKLTFSGGALKCEWRRTFPSLTALSGGTAPDMDGRENDVILFPSLTKGFVLDIPLVEDADNDLNPQLYVAAGKYYGYWVGATVWEGSDGTYDDDFAGVEPDNGATWGHLTTALDDANPNLWDRGNSFEVTIYGGGTLSNSTEAAINADPSINRCIIGRQGRWEIVNFTTATLTDTTEITKTYEVSGLLRGRRGTEMNTGNHAVGDEFLLLAYAEPVELGTDAVNDNLSFKVQSLGRDPENAIAIDMEPYTGATLKPYAPVIWHVEKDDGTGDITIEIRTRTRIGGNWNGGTIPTGETIDEYEFAVYDGDTFKRTLESTDKTFTYSAADQVTDFGSEIEAADLGGFAYQLSATVGRGFPRAA